MDKIDTFGKWFLAFERRNECSDVVLGIYDTDNDLQVRLYPHARYDGYSMLNEYLAELGITKPAQPPVDPAGWGRQLRAFLLLLITLPARPWSRRLRMKSQGWPTRPLAISRDRFAWRIFSVQDTQKIFGFASQEQVTLNSSLIASFIRQLDVLWAGKTGKIAAGITVSLHKHLGIDASPRNRFSIIDLWLTEPVTPDEISQQIKDKIRRDKHLASWFSYMLPRYVGSWFYGYFMMMVGVFQYRNFVFTNMGKWDASSGNSVFLIPPVFYFNPISVGVICWEGRLAMAVQVHPHVDINSEDIEKIMEGWSTDLLRQQDIQYQASSTTVGNLNIRKMQGDSDS